MLLCVLLMTDTILLIFCIQDPAFGAKVHAKFNKVSTASAAAAAESLEDNHIRLMLVNGRIIRWGSKVNQCTEPVKLVLLFW